MRVPHVRFTVRRMIVAVAVAAALSGLWAAGTRYRDDIIPVMPLIGFFLLFAAWCAIAWLSIWAIVNAPHVCLHAVASVGRRMAPDPPEPGGILRGTAQSSALYRLYSRVVGGTQVLYAMIFGWRAFYLLRFCYHPEFHFKGVDAPGHLDLAEAYFGIIGALLALAGLVGGCGLLALRRWVRRWEAAYLGAMLAGSAVSAAMLSADHRRGPGDYVSFVLFSSAFTLPFVPFLFRRPTGEWTGWSMFSSVLRPSP